MADIENVKQGLRCCDTTNCNGCPFKNEKDETYPLFCRHVLNRDALSVIERLEAEIKKNRQTPMKPGLAMDSTGIYSTCPRCGKKLNEIVSARGYNLEGKYPEYCEDCGLKIDWGLDR